jgi:hypothetical protein
MYTLNAVKLRNELNNRRSGLVIELKNVRINGALQGCSGFITDPATGAVIYVSTDRNHGTVSTALYRLAKNNKDYTGYQNHFCLFGELSEAVVDMLDRQAVEKAKTVQELDDEEDAVWEAAIASGRLRVIPVRG